MTEPGRLRRKLARGEPVAVPSIDRIHSPQLVEILGLIGYECVWIDMEHSDLSFERLGDLICAARAHDMEVIVRIEKCGYSNLIRPLELGASGLILPHCMGPDDARAFVREARFAPEGMRPIGQGIDWKYGLISFEQFVREAQERTILIGQIEDKEGVESADEIAAVPGLDGLIMGPFDLSQSCGIAGQTDHPVIRRATERVAAACARHGKWWGAHAAPGESLRAVLDQGARFLHCAQEVNLLVRGFRNVLDAARQDFDRLGAVAP